MKPPHLLPTIFLTLTCLTIACTGSRPAPSRPRRAVIVVLDMFRADYPRRLRLPALEALYRRATVFENAHVGHLPATTVVSHQEAVQRIPLVFAGPGIPVRRVSGQARLVDLAPTLWELFERPPPARMDGVSLASAIR
jgi:arylsulfatase A-like enzyme